MLVHPQFPYMFPYITVYYHCQEKYTHLQDHCRILVTSFRLVVYPTVVSQTTLSVLVSRASKWQSTVASYTLSSRGLTPPSAVCNWVGAFPFVQCTGWWGMVFA